MYRYFFITSTEGLVIIQEISMNNPRNFIDVKEGKGIAVRKGRESRRKNVSEPRCSKVSEIWSIPIQIEGFTLSLQYLHKKCLFFVYKKGDPTVSIPNMK